MNSEIVNLPDRVNYETLPFQDFLTFSSLKTLGSVHQSVKIKKKRKKTKRSEKNLEISQPAHRLKVAPTTGNSKGFCSEGKNECLNEITFKDSQPL